MFYKLTQTDLSDKVNLFIALAPIVRMKNIGDKPLSLFASITTNKFFENTFKDANTWEMTGYGLDDMKKFFCDLAKQFCETLEVIPDFIDSLFLAYVDSRREAIRHKRRHSGASWKEIAHYAQEIRDKGQFEAYDYGSVENINKYGSQYAPKYDVKKIQNIPIVLFTGFQDDLATPENTLWLYNNLKTQKFYEINNNMNH